MYNCLNNQNLILKEQVIGIKIHLKKKKSIAKHIFKFFNCPSFEGVNRVFGLSVENQEDNKNSIYKIKKYYLTNAEIKKYNVMINRRNYFDQTNKQTNKQKKRTYL